MGACASKFGDRAHQEEGLSQSKEDCAGTSDKGGRPREVGSIEVEEKKKVVGESTGEKKEDWSKDETKRRSLSILFKEVFSGILFRESDAADEKKPKDELKKSQDGKPEMAVAGDTTGGAVEVEKTEKSIQTDKPKDVKEVTVVAEVNSAKQTDKPKDVEVTVVAEVKSAKQTDKPKDDEEETVVAEVKSAKQTDKPKDDEEVIVVAEVNNAKQTDKPKDAEEITVVAEVYSAKSDEPKATSQDLKKEPESEPEIKVVPVSEVAASETERSKVNEAVKEIKDSTAGDDDTKKLTDKL